jgi:polyphosphate kinase 2 (PPK2 family)
MDAYDDAIERTTTDEAPWYVIAADHKWARDLGVARVLVETLEEMHPQYPKVTLDPGIVIPD